MSIARGCELMGIARSTYYEAPSAMPDDTTLIAAITDICNEFEPMVGAASAQLCASMASSLTTNGSGG